jgi:hypothetical protein
MFLISKCQKNLIDKAKMHEKKSFTKSNITQGNK